MFETMVPIVGRVISELTSRTMPSGDKMISFRMVARERRYNRENQEWVDGDKLFIGVKCWRKLAENVQASLFKGDDIVVYGRMYLNEYEANGETRSAVELEARAIGPDLSRWPAMVQRPLRADTSSEPAMTPSAVAA